MPVTSMIDEFKRLFFNSFYQLITLFPNMTTVSDIFIKKPINLKVYNLLTILITKLIPVLFRIV
jgi:hypothetical protein